MSVTSDHIDEEQCRVCRDLSIDTISLIQPCKCRGTMKYVHLNCWNQMGHRCIICNYPPASQLEQANPQVHVNPHESFNESFRTLLPILAQCFQSVVEPSLKIERDRLAFQSDIMERMYHFTETGTYRLFHGLIVLYFGTILIGMICNQVISIVALGVN